MAMGAETVRFEEANDDYLDQRADHGTAENTTRLYLDEVGRYPLLTREQEIDLAKRIETGRLAQQELEDQNCGLADERRQELETLAVDGETARQNFTQSNLRLVVSIAKRYHPENLELVDLIQEGNAGLMRAIEKFDWRKGFKFSTYATWWIHQAIQRGISKTDRAIRLPAHKNEAAQRVSASRKILLKSLGREPTREEIAEHADVSSDKIDTYQLWNKRPLSLDEPVREKEQGGHTTLADYQQDVAASDELESKVRDLSTRQTVYKILEVLQSDELVSETLSPREAWAIDLRFGLSDGEPKSFKTVASRLNVSASTAKYVESKALQKMKLAADILGFETDDIN